MARDKSKRGNYCCQFLKPSTRCLFETVKSFSELANFSWFVRDTSRWCHINFFIQVTIQTSIFDIQLRYFLFTTRSNCNQGSYYCHFCNKSKCLFIIHTILLSITFGNKSSLISSMDPSDLVLILQTHREPIARLPTGNGTKSHVCLMQCSKFLNYSTLPN